jgi:hypothetical protein
VTEHLEREFPRLALNGYSVTSEATAEYNCVAWAAGDDSRWWWPDAMDQYYWPPTAPREESVRSFVAALAAVGFEPCLNGDHEPGQEKVALFADARGIPTHAARQLPNGRWTSKMGRWEDITHDRLTAVQGAAYGRPVTFLRRAIPSPS